MLKNVGSNWFLMAVTGLATFFLMPFNLHHLGTVQYGIWLVISAQTAYLFLLHLGVPMASVREMTQAIAAGDRQKLNGIIASCSVLYVGFGIAAMVLGLPLLLDFEHHYSVPAELHGSARTAFVIALLQIGIGFLANMPFAILSAYQAFVVKNALQSAAIIFRVIVNVVLVSIDPDLSMVAISLVGLTIFEMVVGWAYVLKTYPDVRPRLADFKVETLRSIVRFSIYVFLLALGSQLAFQTSAIIIGRWMSATDVVTFGVPNSLMIILVQFVGGISSVMMPVATFLHTREEMPELRAVLYKWTKIALALSWCAGVFLLVFGPAFMAFWIKQAYDPEAGYVLRVLMVSYLVLLPVRAVATPLLMGIGDAKWITLATLAAGALNVILSVAWIGPYGLAGMAWATFVPNVLLAFCMVGLVCRAMSIPVRTYLAETMPLPAIGGFAALVVLGWWKAVWGPTDFLGLGVAGLMTLVVCAAIWGGLVLRNDAHVTIPRFSEVLPWRLQW